jgi:hypothetical protein
VTHVQSQASTPLTADPMRAILDDLASDWDKDEDDLAALELQYPPTLETVEMKEVIHQSSFECYRQLVI